MVAEESSVANPQKVSKIDEKSEKWKKMGWQHCFCQRITRFLGIIGEIYQISRHRCHRLIIGYHGWDRLGT